MTQIHFLVGVLLGVTGAVGFALILQPAQTIPPTHAFSDVFINSERIVAKSYNDMLNITTEGIITTEVNEQANHVTMKLSSFNCPFLQGVTGFDENGEPVCGVL